MKTKYFRINRAKEHRDISTLIKMLKPIIRKDTVIVNASPEFSSMISQRVAHAYFDMPLQMLPLDMPYKNTPFEKVYEAHCIEFAKELEPNRHYVFIDSGILRGRNFKTLYDVLCMYSHKSISFDFGCLYSEDTAIFTADFCVEYFNRENDGMLLFWWENENNPMFD
jgi:hypothetical protein